MVGYIYFRLRILLFRGLQRLITAPAQTHATKIAVYTALLLGGGDLMVALVMVVMEVVMAVRMVMVVVVLLLVLNVRVLGLVNHS